MSAAWVSVPVQLWRGELRVQGLLLRRPLVTAVQTIVFLAIYISVVLRVRDALMSTGPAHTLNIAVLTLSIGLLMAANATLVGERTGTLPWQLQQWATTLPLGSAQVARLIVALSALKSGLVTVSLLAAVAIGALFAAHSWTSVVIILSSVVLLPLLPLALGLQWARTRGASPSLAFTIVPLGVGVGAVAVELPLASGWAETALGWIAFPGMLLAGRASLGEGVAFLAAWTGLALVLLRPAALSLRDTLVNRGFGSSIWRLTQIPRSPSPERLALDLAIHKVGLTDLLEILFLGAASCSVVLLQTFARNATFGNLAMVGAFSTAGVTAAIAGYVHMKATVQLDPTTEAWVGTLPVSARALSVAKHAVAAGGALLAVVPAMVLGIAKAGWPPEQGAFTLALWTGMSAVALTGWFAVFLSMRGWVRQLGGHLLFGWYSVRAVAGAAILAASNNLLLVAALFVVDLGIGLVGHWRGAIAASQERAR